MKGTYFFLPRQQKKKVQSYTPKPSRTERRKQQRTLKPYKTKIREENDI